MVQLSIQDMTQESKVRARTALWEIVCACAHARLVGRAVLRRTSAFWAACKGKGFLEKQDWYCGTYPYSHPAPLQAVYCTNSPVWEEAFRFFLQDPRSQELDVQVR